MTALTGPRMTVDEFLARSEGQPGRYEFFRGEVVAKSPEVIGHTKIKGAVYFALHTDIRKRRRPCHTLIGGPMVRIDDGTAYEPDALAYCGQELPSDDVEVANPVIIVEVLSPSTHRVDVSLKLAGYFRLPSVTHYLVVDPTQPNVIHHSRGAGDTILTRIVTQGSVTLDPPGLGLNLSEIHEQA